MADPARAPASRSERRKARTEAAILDAAERHFLERGFQAAKVDEIAEEADVAVGSVYNHFASKEGLYRAALDRALDLFETYMEGEPERGTPALEQLLEVAGRVARRHARAARERAHGAGGSSGRARAGRAQARAGARLAPQRAARAGALDS